MNSDMSDIASALTGSLARDGQGGMTDTLLLDNDGLAYVSDTNTGLYRSGADTQRIKAGGTDTVELGADTKVLSGDFEVTLGDVDVVAGGYLVNGQPFSASDIAVSDGPVLLGREASGVGVGEEIDVGTGLDLTSGVLTAVAILPAGYLYGLTLSNGVSDPTNDITVAVGSARDQGDAQNMVLGSAITKQLDGAWSVGNNQGGLDTGSIANITYHVYEIMRPDTGVVDVCFSASASAPTTGGAIPAAYTSYRRIGSIIRTGGAILAFSQAGDQFLLSVPVANYTLIDLPTSATVLAVTAPEGIKVDAIINATYATANNKNALISSYDQADSDPATLWNMRGTADSQQPILVTTIRTNTSAQIRGRASVQIDDLFSLFSFGWYDTRGRDA